jgi:hypothetical protein
MGGRTGNPVGEGGWKSCQQLNKKDIYNCTILINSACGVTCDTSEEFFRYLRNCENLVTAAAHFCPITRSAEDIREKWSGCVKTSAPRKPSGKKWRSARGKLPQVRNAGGRVSVKPRYGPYGLYEAREQ